MQYTPTTEAVVTVVVTNPQGQPNNGRWTNRKQSNAASVVLSLFMIGGMDLAQGLGWNFTVISTTQQFQYSWFIGMLAGAILSALLLSFVPKMIFYGLGALLTLIEGIIFVSAPFEYAAILAARYLGGIGLGLVTVPYIVHSTEIAARDYRGICSAFEQYMISLGIVIQVIYSTQGTLYDAGWTNRVHGIVVIILSACALGSVSVTIESPIFYLRRNEEDKARACQRRLMNEIDNTAATEVALAEAKLYVLEGNNESQGSLLSGSMIPFFKLLFVRCFVAFSISVPLTYAIRVSSQVALGYYFGWPIVVWPILRMVGSLLAVFVLDRFGRKFVTFLGLIVMAGMMLTMAGVFAVADNVESNYYMWVVCRVAMTFQFFAGIYIVSTPTYLGEAFPMSTKGPLIALIVAIEQVVHIIVIITFPYTIDGLYLYFVIVGIILAVGVVCFGTIMPETRSMTLREAGTRFRRPHDVMAY